jgi:hypothetical protein
MKPEIHSLNLPTLKKYIASQTRNQNEAITVTGLPLEGETSPILITTPCAFYKIPSVIYTMTFQALIHRNAPVPGTAFSLLNSSPVDADAQAQQWLDLKEKCQNPATPTPYYLRHSSTASPALNLFWCEAGFAFYMNAAVLNTVEVDCGTWRAGVSDLTPIYYNGINTEAFLMPYRRWLKGDTFLEGEAALARAWSENNQTTV